MTIIGGYRHSGVIDASGAVNSTIINFSGFQPTGLTDGNVLGVALYVWSGSMDLTKGFWTPMRREWFTS